MLGGPRYDAIGASRDADLDETTSLASDDSTMPQPRASRLRMINQLRPAAGTMLYLPQRRAREQDESRFTRMSTRINRTGSADNSKQYMIERTPSTVSRARESVRQSVRQSVRMIAFSDLDPQDGRFAEGENDEDLLDVDTWIQNSQNAYGAFIHDV